MFVFDNQLLKMVTILILVDGFLQYDKPNTIDYILECHNPYFSRWFSAILVDEMLENAVRIVTILILVDGFLQ